MGCGVELEANDLIVKLLAGESFDLPVVDLNDPLLKLPVGINDKMYQKVVVPTIDEVTSGVVGGSGVFDKLMQTINAHLKDEFQQGRITGAEYSKTYIALTQTAMGSAIQFTLGAPQAFWEAQKAQIAAITGRMAIEQAKLQTAQVKFEALQAKTNYAAAKSKLASESVQYCILKFQHEKMLPEQHRGLIFDADNKQVALTVAKYSAEHILPIQKELATEQANAARAQTYSNRMDGQEVTGTLGAQRLLSEQQVKSYKQDAVVKGVKIFSDAYSVQKTIDEGVVPPNNFTNAEFDKVLNTLRSTLELG